MQRRGLWVVLIKPIALNWPLRTWSPGQKVGALRKILMRKGMENSKNTEGKKQFEKKLTSNRNQPVKAKRATVVYGKKANRVC